MRWDDRTTPQDIIDFARELFAKQNIKTESKIIVNEQRQTSGLGCTMFATRDAMVISANPSILQQQSSSPMLWPLIKSAQTSKIPEQLKKQFEKEFSSIPINKKGLTYQGFLFKNFRHNPILNKKSNYYMHDKLGKWRDKVIDFLKNNSNDTVQEKTKELTLDGFLKKHLELILGTHPRQSRV